jgi:predicted membrane channel-forming protein YqfA (hemolysin III family)
VSYYGLLILLSSGAILSIVLIKLLKKGKKLFVRKTNFYLLGFLLICALAGLTTFLTGKPGQMERSTMMLLLLLFFLALGILHNTIFEKYHPWAKADRFLWGPLYQLLLVVLGGIVFFIAFSFFEHRRAPDEALFADNLAWVLLIFPLPYFLEKSYQFFLEIPRKEVQAWVLPVDENVSFIEPGRSLVLHFSIPLDYKSGELYRINTRAPIDKPISEIFHYILYRHNVEQRSPKKIAIAEGNSRNKVYGWLFHVKVKQFWWYSRKFLSPDERIRAAGLRNGDVIHATRVKVWQQNGH